MNEIKTPLRLTGDGQKWRARRRGLERIDSRCYAQRFGDDTPFPPRSEIIFVPTSARGCSKRRRPGVSSGFQKMAEPGAFSVLRVSGRFIRPLSGSLAEEAVSMLQVGEGRGTKGESVSRSLGKFSLIYYAIIGATLARASTSFSGHIETP